jgi:hypothetical protein
VGAVWLELARRGWLPPRRTAQTLAALALIVAPESLYEIGWRGPGLGLGLAVGLGLLVAGTTLGRTTILGLGVAALLLFMWRAAADYWGGRAVPLGILVLGLGLVAAAVTLSRSRTAGSSGTPSGTSCPVAANRSTGSPAPLRQPGEVRRRRGPST